MNEALKSQLTKFTLIVVLFIITPLLSASMRPPYLYFLLNLLIISLGTQTGLLSFHNKPVFVNPPVVEEKESADKCSDNDTAMNKKLHETTHQKINMVEESSASKVKKCPSLPSLFFIGGDEAETADIVEHEEEEEELGAISGQELFVKAETFIGNFYKQLKIQREESWNRIHGFYQQMAY